MEEVRLENERKKRNFLRALDIGLQANVTKEELKERVNNPEKLVDDLRAELKRKAWKNVAVIFLNHVDVDEEKKRLKAFYIGGGPPKRLTLEPARRSGRLSKIVPEYTFDDLDEVEEERVKQRSSQVSRGEIGPLVARENTYGPIQGVKVGDWWATRLECSHAGVHRMTVAGIHGGPDGAYAIAVSGGYAENQDLGESLWFTGEGGRDLKGTKSNPKNLRTAPQSKDQGWTKGNAALHRSFETQKPVRVVRGFSKNKEYTSPWAPSEGYRYDGLYVVDNWKEDGGVTGFKVLKFHLTRLPGQDPIQLYP